MPTLSITQGHDTGAAIVQDGTIVAAINEERLSRVKNESRFPEESIETVLKIAGFSHDDIDHVVIPELTKGDDIAKNIIPKYPQNVFAGVNGKSTIGDKSRQLVMSSALLFKTYSRMLIEYRQNEKRMKRLFPRAQFHRVEHHITHGASAYYTSGFDKALVLTADAWGDFVSTMIAVYEGKKIKSIERCYYPNSLGHFYQSVTNWLGFRGGRHEGKVLGLAAFGNPDSEVYCRIKDLLQVDGLRIYTPNMMGVLWHKKMPLAKNCLMRELVENHTREDIAAAFQRRFEEVFTELVRNCLEHYQVEDIALAGGVFANVKLNQRIQELPGVRQVYIFPNMGDGGVCAGGALFHDINMNGSDGYKLPHAYLGPDFTEKQIAQALEKNGMPFERFDHIEPKLAELLTKGKVIARFNGAMEFGPRALGNRSILYPATDPSVNKWLNDRLNRTEFMPFAPITLLEEAETCYKNISKSIHPAMFMTMTFDCTKFMKEQSPAAVHVDGTARPQLIDEKTNKSYYNIVKEYFKLTGIPSIINTSFNMHEEPIVCTPNDAIRAFKLGALDYLAMGSFLVKGEGQD